jgi:hypothetical protein
MWPQGQGVDTWAPGKTRLGALFFILLVIAGIYLAIKFIPPYWTYLSMQDPVKEAAMTLAMQGGDEVKVRADLVRQAAAQGLAFDDDNIYIDRQGGVLLVVRVRWVARVDLPGLRYRIPFRIEERVPLR